MYSNFSGTLTESGVLGSKRESPRIPIYVLVRVACVPSNTLMAVRQFAHGLLIAHLRFRRSGLPLSIRARLDAVQYRSLYDPASIKSRVEVPLRVGLVGAGPWASMVHAPMLARNPKTELVGVWARRETAAQSLAAQHQGPPPISRSTTSPMSVMPSHSVSLLRCGPTCAARAARRGRCATS